MIRTASLAALAALVLLAAAPSSTDATFVRQALASAHEELAEAAIQKNSSDPNVRYYAQSMIIDHTAIDARLTALAKQLGISIAGITASPAPEKSVSSKAYLQDQLSEHGKTVALYQHEAASGSDPQLQVFASQVVPVLQSHVSLAQKLLDREEGKSTVTAPAHGYVSAPPSPSPSPSP